MVFKSIEGLRAFMAWWVVVGHAIHLGGDGVLPAAMVKLLGAGHIAVNVFIIVSGFVIAHLCVDKREGYGGYILRRFFRIFPIYLVSIIIALLSVNAYIYSYIELPYAFDSQMRIDRIRATNENFFTHLGLHLTMLHGIIPESILKYASNSILSPAWSLSLEWQFYLLAPFIIGLISRRLFVWSFFLVVFSLTSKYIFGADYEFPSMLALSLWLFVVGILSRLLLNYDLVFQKSPLIFMITLVVVFLILRNPELMIWSVAYTIIAVESEKFSSGFDGRIIRTIKWILTNRTSRWLGSRSYSTYLLHIPIFSLILYLYGHGMGLIKPNEIWILLAISFPVIALISWILYACIERPFIKIGARLADNQNSSELIIRASN